MIEKTKEEVFWQCNECKLMYPEKRVANCIRCGANSDYDSTKRRIYIKQDVDEKLSCLQKEKEEVTELLVDVLNQACCSDSVLGIIDNECISAYEGACLFLKKKGLLIRENDRIFRLVVRFEDELDKLATPDELAFFKGRSVGKKEE